MFILKNDLLSWFKDLLLKLAWMVIESAAKFS